ncbi:EamA family transporter [Phaeocystidibacter luteus]|uniref:EamA family transporter n=1 Tax=Phaeocystidibacter luteus TaxID=911197 RepID=A0A6N6RLN2_9FLAO|nr:EamA family transporter [Phaeocystidibacter luteus]KAB2814484.1 EamA family transporter [Phaeocystidibacter luteus]
MMYILLSIVCSTIIFILFKLFSKYRVDNLQAIVANYFIAGTLGWLPLPQESIEYTEWSIWPFVIGIMFITLFQLMAKVTQDHGVNVVSVTVKMSVVIPILSGILLLNDYIDIPQVVGILLALFAVYAINRPSGDAQRNNSGWVGLTILFIGSGLLDSFLKIIENGVVHENHLSYFTSSAFGIAGVLGVLFVIYKIYVQKSAKWSAKSWIWGLILGIPNYGSIYFLMKALGGEYPSAVLFPINNVGVVALSALAALLLFNERITKWRAIGLISAAAAIILMSAQ